MQGEDLSYVVQDLYAKIGDLQNQITTAKVRQGSFFNTSQVQSTPADVNLHTVTATKTGWGIWSVSAAGKCPGAAVTNGAHMLYTNSAAYPNVGGAYQTLFSPAQNPGANVGFILDTRVLVFPVTAGGSYTLTWRPTFGSAGNNVTFDIASGVLFVET